METTTLQVLLRAGIVALAVLVVTGLSVYARRHPNRAGGMPGGVRLPRFVAVVGWLFVVVGGVMCLAALGDDVPVGMQVAAVLIVGGGLLFLVGYRNWYIVIGTDEVTYRTFFGFTRTVRYHEVASYSITQQHGVPVLTLRAVDGSRFTLNPRTFDVTALLTGIDDERRRFGLPAIQP